MKNYILSVLKECEKIIINSKELKPYVDMSLLYLVSEAEII